MPGETNLTKHKIRTGDAISVQLPPHHIPAYRNPVENEIHEMLFHGVIKPSRSEWAAPMVIIKKADGSLRICVDYRLNSKTKVDAYPIPRNK